jgi:SAM-dependent methyltransferase
MNPAMREYYDRRAGEYDDWWLGTGRFADRDRPGWDEDVSGLCEALRRLPPARTVDLACGTGFLTRFLPGEVTGVDQSEAMLAIARERRRDATFAAGDALAFDTAGFERVFTAHFYGHLDEAQRERLQAVESELVVVDSAFRGVAEEWQERVLNDGSRHRVYKRWFTAGGLAAELGGGTVLHDGPWFVALVRAGAAQ